MAPVEVAEFGGVPRFVDVAVGGEEEAGRLFKVGFEEVAICVHEEGEGEG